MKKLILFAFILLSGPTTFSQSTAQTVTIGDQVWMTKNLNVDKFRNGDTIPEAKTQEEWIKAGVNKQPAWCYYENDPANGKKYGKLYNWYAVNDKRGLAPLGYHIPSETEWKMMIDFLGGEIEAKNKLKSINGWAENGNGTNSSGFSGFPSGAREVNGIFSLLGGLGAWWSSSDDGPKDKYGVNKNGLNFNVDCSSRVCLDDNPKEIGLPVRAIKN